MNNMKSNIAWVLQTIASKSLRDKYAKNIGFSDQSAIDELICCWADDLYHPSSPFFQGQFESHEMKIFEEFNKIIDVYAGDKSKQNRSLIMDAAKTALKKLQ